jgi:hypothetical protein
LERSVPVREAVRGRVFRFLAAAFFLNALGQIALHVHLVPYLTERGYSAAFAASAAGLVGIMALPGRLIFTPLGDKLPRAYLTAFIFAEAWRWSSCSRCRARPASFCTLFSSVRASAR